MESVPQMLQVNFTDTKLSHRFIRFEVPSSEDFVTRCASIKEFLDRKLQNRSTTGVVIAKMQEDTDLNAQDDAQVISKASNKDTGSRFITVNMVCDVANERCYQDTSVPKAMRPQTPGRLDFKADLVKSFEDYSRQEKELIDIAEEDQLYQQPKVTEIGVSVLVNQRVVAQESRASFRDIGDLDDQQLLLDPRKNEFKLRRWAMQFHTEVINPIEQGHLDYLTQTSVPSNREKFELYCKYFELRPYKYAIN